MNLVDHLFQNALLYDLIQYAVGANIVRRHLRPELRQVGEGIVLDIGAGTGLYASCVPDSARYVWCDNDPEKLRGFQARRKSRPALLGDATNLPFIDKSVDWTLCVNMSHHLSDPELSLLLAEMQRVTRRAIVLHDPVDDLRWMSRILWKYDRGSHPRTARTLLTALASRFTVHTVQEYARFHRYVLIVAAPR
jgi:SAM-dependent methyltransferase